MKNNEKDIVDTLNIQDNFSENHAQISLLHMENPMYFQSGKLSLNFGNDIKSTSICII